MQTHGGQAAADAIEGRERRFTPRLLVDWNRSGAFDHPLSDLSRYASPITTDRNLAGTVPDEVALIEGAAAAELRATLSGTYGGESLVQVFSPYNGRSMFYLHALEGCPVSYSILVHTALGTVEYPQFQGVVRSTSPDRGANTVELEALDRVEQLRQPVSFPQWAVIERLASRGIIDAQLANTQWVIDHCLRRCDVSPTGIRHTTRAEMGAVEGNADGVHLWLTGSGSVMPTRGWMDNAEAQRFPHTEAGEPAMYREGVGHPDNESSDPAPLAFNGLRGETSDGYELRYWAQDRDLMLYQGLHILRLTVVDDGSGYIDGADLKIPIQARIDNQNTVSIEMQGSTVSAVIRNWVNGDSRTHSVTFTAGTHDILAAFDTWTVDTDDYMWLAIDGVSADGWVAHTPVSQSSGTYDPLKGLCVLNHRLPLQDVAWCYRSNFDANSAPLDPADIQRPAAYRAVLDEGMNRLSYMPQNAEGSDAWDVISAVASAEWGAVHWDERGVFRFWNYDTVTAKQDEIVRTVTVDDLGSLSARRSLDSVRNVYSVEATRKREVMTIVYESNSEDEFFVGQFDTKHFRIWDTSIVSAYPHEVPRHTTIANSADTNFPTWGDDVTHGCVVSYFKGGVWQEANDTSDVLDVYAYFNIDGYLVIRVANSYDYDLRFTTDDGSPAFRLWGTKTTDNADPQIFQHRYPDSIAKYGERNMKLSGDWYQDGFDHSRMIDTMAERTTKPVPVTDQLTIPGDPRLQLGDTLEVNDADGFGERLPAQTVGSKRTLDIEQGLSETLTVQIIRPPGQWVLGSAAYSVLGQSTALS